MAWAHNFTQIPASSPFHRPIQISPSLSRFLYLNKERRSQKRSREPLSLRMAPYFVFPQNLKSLEEENDDNRLHVLNPTDVASLRLPEVEEFVKGQFYSCSIRLIKFMS